MLGQILSIVTPVFGLILVGWLYGRRHGPDMSAANRVNLDVFIPALIFHVLATEELTLGDHLPLAAAGALVVLGSGGLAWIAARLAGIDPRTLVPPMMFINSGNMGLPLAVLAFGAGGLAPAVVLFMVENLLHFTLGVRILDRRSHPLAVLRMPLVLASLLGLAASFLDLAPPAPIGQGIEMLGQVAIPLMLFALGVRLNEARWGEHWRIALLGTLLRPAAGLVAALLAIGFIPLAEGGAEQLILFAMLPPAVLNFVIAERYGQEPEVVAAIVIWGNLASLIVIPLTLAVVLAG